MPSSKVQPLVQPGLDTIRADDTINVKPVDCASRKYHEHQQTAYRLSAKQGAALSQDEQQARQKLAQEAPVVLAQLEASAKTKIAAQLAASVGLATLKAPKRASGRNNTPYRQQSLPALHSSAWFKRLGLPKHSKSAVWPTSGSTVQQAAGSWILSSSPSQAAAMHHSAAAHMVSKARMVQVPSLANLDPQQQQGPQVCILQRSLHQVVPNVAGMPLKRAAWQQNEGSMCQPTWEPCQQKHEQCPQLQLPPLQPRSTAQECTGCMAAWQLVRLSGSDARAGSSSSPAAHSWDARGCSGLAISTQPPLPGSTEGTLHECSMQPPSLKSIADSTSDSCCLESEHELQPLLGQLRHPGSQHVQETHSPFMRSQLINTADTPKAEVPGLLISEWPPCGASSKRPASPVAQVLMTCHAAAVAALGSTAASVGPDPMLEPLLTSATGRY